MMPRIPLPLDPAEVEKLRRSYSDLVLALARKCSYSPENVLDLGRDLIDLSGSIDQAVLAQDFERILGIKANATLERLLRGCAERGVSFDRVLGALQRFCMREVRPPGTS